MAFIDDLNAGAYSDPGMDAQKAIGATANAAKALALKGYSKLPQSIQNVTTPALKGTYNAVEPLASKVFNQIGEWPLREGTNMIANLLNSKPPLENAGQVSKVPNSSSFHDVINALPKGYLMDVLTGEPGAGEAMPKASGILNNDAGMAANLFLDPLMHFHLGGLTKAGQTATKAGTEASTLGAGAAKGERSLATLGTVPLVPKVVSKVALGGLTKANQLIDKVPGLGGVKAGLQTQTGNVGYDNAKLQKLTNPNNASTVDAIKMRADDEKVINNTAKEMGVTPEELHQKMLNYMEPLGSQNPPKGQVSKSIWQQKINAAKEEAGKALPPEIKALADNHIGGYNAFNLSEGGKTRQNYVEHNSTPEWNDLVSKVYPKIYDPAKKALDSVKNDSAKGRGVLGKYTINEINNIAQAGNLGSVPGLGNIPQLDEFKGKVFDDNTARVQASRYLENAKVLNQADFMNHLAKTYGVPKDALLQKYRNGSIKAGDLVEVQDKHWVNKDNPDGTLSFPPEIAKSLEKMKNMGADSPWEKEMKGSWAKLNDFTKKSYFGIFPASVGKIYLGNQALAYISGLWSPVAQAQGLRMAMNLRTGKLSDKIILNHSTLGPLSEKDVYNLLKANRAYGMGLFKMEVPKAQMDTYLGSKTAQKYVDKMWQAHNFAEDATRMGTAIEALRQGYNPFAAGKAARKALYDYSDLGEADKKMKNLAPFYTFQRKNLENMAKKWIQNPGRAGLPLKFQNEEGQDKQDERQYFSNSKAEGTPLNLGGPDNITLGLNSVWPANDVNRYTGSGKTFGEIFGNMPKSIMKTVAGMINPIFRVPGEVATNYNLNAGTPIEKMPGQQAVGPFGIEMNKRYAQYPLSQIRAVNDPSLPFTSSSDKPWQIATRLATGLSFKNADPVQEKNFSDIEQLLGLKGSHIDGEKNLPRFFAKAQERYQKAGNLKAAKAAYDNEKISYQQLLDDAKQFRKQ